MQPKEFTNFYNSLYDLMRPGLNKTTGPGLLKDYSPWLQNFQANEYSEAIEIPGTNKEVTFTGKYCQLCIALVLFIGQYNGKSKPLPEYHVKISGFDEKVLT